MATLRPFAAWRPRPDIARQFCSPPYDVMNEEEARAIIAREPMSFLQVTRSEAVMPAGTDPHGDEVYSTAQYLWEDLRTRGFVGRDEAPCYYLYRLVWRGRSQTGLVALASCAEYREGIVRRHEFTRPDKENDRTRHIATLQAQTGPVFLAYRGDRVLDQLLRQLSQREPDYDFVAGDGVAHSLWVISDRVELAELESAAAALPMLYICDGHHRAAAANRVAQSSPEDANQHFLSVTFPHHELQILPYHRLVLDAGGMNDAQMLAAIERVTDPAGPAPVNGEPPEPGTFCCCIGGRWHWRRFTPQARATAADATAALDVSLLQTQILQPIFRIDDPRTDPRIQFVGGIRGTEELARSVMVGDAAIAFAMYPTAMEDLFRVADAGKVMPPKSTWFEPKLRDGLVVHAFD